MWSDFVKALIRDLNELGFSEASMIIQNDGIHLLLKFIAMIESGGNWSAINKNTNGTSDVSIYGINTATYAFKPGEVSDPIGSTRAAIHIMSNWISNSEGFNKRVHIAFLPLWICLKWHRPASYGGYYRYDNLIPCIKDHIVKTNIKYVKPRIKYYVFNFFTFDGTRIKRLHKLLDDAVSAQKGRYK